MAVYEQGEHVKSARPQTVGGAEARPPPLAAGKAVKGEECSGQALNKSRRKE